MALPFSYSIDFLFLGNTVRENDQTKRKAEMKNILILVVMVFSGVFIQRTVKKTIQCHCCGHKTLDCSRKHPNLRHTSEDQIKAVFSTNSFDTVFNLSGFANLDQEI